MAITANARHPRYVELIGDWTICRDTYRGESRVKSRDQEYLPATSGMIQDGMQADTQLGYQQYQAYKNRAVYHDFMADCVETAIGVMFSKPPTIELPAQLEGMRANASVKGEPLEMLLRRINEQQMVTGRLGLLLDMPAIPDPTTGTTPYIVLYNAESIINWDDGSGEFTQSKPRLNLVVLDESAYERETDFTWAFNQRYRVLYLGSLEANEQPGAVATYRFAIVESDDAQATSEDFVEALVKGQPITDIPFVFINSKDMVADPDDPPLLGLAMLAIAAYRGEADYRQALFMQAQDTLVTIGAGEQNFRIGAGGVINLKPGADAKFIGVSADGLSEQREALNNDKMEAAHRAGQLIDARSRPFESGDALQTRMAAQTATLTQIAVTGARALETILKIAAEWVGANPEEVKVRPNLDFKLEGLISRELVEMMTAKQMGAPLSNQSIHAVMQERGLTRFDYEDELELIAKEEPLVAAPGTDAGGNPEESEAEEKSESSSEE